MYIFKRSLFGILITMLTVLAGSIQAQTAPVVQVCQLSDFTAGPFGHSIYLHYLPGAITPRYRWDSAGGTLTIFSDSSAVVTGRVFNDSLPNWQWDVELWLIDQRDFATWDALGRDVKIEYAPANLVQANKQDWLFWEFDSTRSRLYGVPGTHWDGDTLEIRHNPPNRQYGAQFGIAANAKNGNFGISGWFLFDGPGYSGHGDINANASCGPPPCDLVAAGIPICLTDTTFGASIVVTGTGGPYVIRDNQGTNPLIVNAAGTYMFGTYANGDTVSIFVNDSLAVGCADTITGITTDCTPPPVCDVAIDSASAVCVTDTTFDITVSISGTGAYTLSDDNGILATGLAAGSYTFGPYGSNSVVTLFVEDPTIAGCADTLGGLTANCTPPPVCDVAIDSASAVCVTDTTFDITVSISGTGAYTLSDDNGILATGLAAGSYTFGPYGSNSVVTLFVEDPTIAGCADTLGGLTANCTPPPVCDVAIDSASAVCVTDTTFELQVTFSGTGPYTLFDDQGSTPLTGLSGGTYSYGVYPSNQVVTVYLADPSIAGCVDSLVGLTQTCVSVPPVCGVAIDSVFADCASDTSFTIFVKISGVGSNFQISDDQGSMSVGGLSAGWYSFGDYFNSTEVLLTVTDLTIPGCDTTVGPLTADCTPVAVCDLAIDTIFATCLSDTTFEVTVNILGTGQFYQLFDNQGSNPLFPVDSGMYTFGPYPNGTPVTITASDFAIFNCFATAGPVTETCSTGSITQPKARLWADAHGNRIVVGWEAEFASLISGFFVERSIDPELESGWETISWVPVSLPVSYPANFEYVDQSISPMIDYYYRVKIIPTIGNDGYSNEASARIYLPGGIWIGDFYPNPSTGESVSIGISSSVQTQISWQLFSTTGAMVRGGILTIMEGQQAYNIKLADPTPGVYFLQLWHEGSLLRSKKMIIMN